MINKDNASSTNLRGNTDKSLNVERSKADKYLEEKNESITKNAEKAIRSNRIAADQKKENIRNETDIEKPQEHPNKISSQASNVEDKKLILEREKSDEAQLLERNKEDSVRTKERLQKRLIAEALMSNERKETDTNLSDERSRIDLDSEQHQRQLIDEQESHGATKSALLTRDQFLAIVSHDLKNPLGAISLSANLIRLELAKDEFDLDKIFQMVDVIDRSSANMDRLISDMLDIERMDHGKFALKPEKGDICSVLKECLDLFAPVVASRNFAMTIEQCSSPLAATFDRDRLLQVLSNLVGNALKFTPEGGSINLSAKKKVNELEISVSDNGPGISEDKVARIFEKFSQLNSGDRRGLGLGLFISKWIVEAHKGRIWVSSKMGEGSVFTFTLPLDE